MTSPESSPLEDLCQRTADLVRAAGGPLKGVRVRAGDLSVEVEWQDLVPASNGTASHASPLWQSPVEAPAEAPATATEEGTTVTAPLVGTFYRSPSPGAQPFVDVGSVVEKGQQLAIIEAMKLMNAVTAETSGRVVEILVADATPVEYGEALLVLTAV